MIPKGSLGLGLRVAHLRHILDTLPTVDFFELISENFMVEGGPPLENLRRICAHYPVVLHGVSMGIGSADELDQDYLQRLKELVTISNAPWFSDHLCWTRYQGIQHHDLLPLPYTKEIIAFVAERARYVQDLIGIPFALENLSSYVAFRQSQMPEWEFYRQIIEQADCYMMLDVNNVYVSAMNHGYDPWDYMRAIPWDRVLQLHIAGHSVRPDGYRIDTHDQRVAAEVWELYAYAAEQSQGAPTILEWDDNHLSFSETWQHAQLARRYMPSVRSTSHVNG